MTDPRDNTTTDLGDDHISKSARKREAEALQALGLRLTKLKSQQLEALNLADDLLKSINDYNRFPSREAKRRQLQYVGKLMRRSDVAAIQSRLDALERTSNVAQYQHAQSESWRERLIADPTALSAYIDEYPFVDRQKLRQLVKKTQSAQTEQQRKISARALFRYLHEQELEKASNLGTSDDNLVDL